MGDEEGDAPLSCAVGYTCTIDAKARLEESTGTTNYPKKKGKDGEGEEVEVEGSGDVYEGGYKDGKRHGQGTYTWNAVENYDDKASTAKQMAQYVGMYEAGQKSGAGKMTYPDGTTVRTSLRVRFCCVASARLTPRRACAVRGQLGQRQAPRLRHVHLRQRRHLHGRVEV